MRTLLLLLLLAAPAWAQEAPADLVLFDGAVYTMDASRSWATGVALRGGRVARVGTDEEVLALRGPATRVVDLQGRMVLPGFHDCHVHPVLGGLELAQCYLGDLPDGAAVPAAVARYAAAHPDQEWIVGSGWHLPWFPPEGPRKEALDAVVPSRPVVLAAADGHSAWVNSEALRRAGITRATPDPPAGRVERSADGEPTGILRESAIELVEVPEPSREAHAAALRSVLPVMHGFGLTSFVEAHASPAILQAYEDLQASGELSARVVASLSAGRVGDLSALRSRAEGPRLRAFAVKFFVDGVLESRTAALLEPYVGGGLGDLSFEPSQVADVHAAGFDLHFHAIGDRGVRAALDALEAAFARHGRRDARPQLAHLELVDPADVPRFRRLGAVADFQPLWAHADEYITELTVPVLGPARSARLYPLGTLMRSGAVVAAGSDWSVSSMNPLEAIQVAVTRRGPTEAPGEAWLPDQVVSLPEILAAYTIGGAWTMRQERETGSLEAGKAADLVVLDRNLFEVPPHEIARVRVLLTLVDGEEVFRAEDFRW